MKTKQDYIKIYKDRWNECLKECSSWDSASSLFYSTESAEHWVGLLLFVQNSDIDKCIEEWKSECDYDNSLDKEVLSILEKLKEQEDEY